MTNATGQKAMEGLEGRNAKDILGLDLPKDNFHLRVRVSALILCETNEGEKWNFERLDGQGRTMWRAAAGGKGRCNVDPSSKTVVRG